MEAVRSGRRGIAAAGIVLVLLVAAYYYSRPVPASINYVITVRGYQGRPLDNASVSLYSANQMDGSRKFMATGYTKNGVLEINGSTAVKSIVAVVVAGNYSTKEVPLEQNITVRMDCSAAEFVDSGRLRGGDANCTVGEAHTRFRLGQLVTEFLVYTPSSKSATGLLDCGNGQNYTLQPFPISYDNFLTACGYRQPGLYNVTISVNNKTCWKAIRADYPCAG